MKNLLIVFLLICNFHESIQIKLEIDANQYYVNPEIKPYIDNFEKIYKKDIRGLRVVFNKLKDGAGGNCLIEYMTEDFYFKKTIKKLRIITIDPFVWKTLSASERERMIFHELGHCVLNRSHKNDEIHLALSNNAVNSSVMNWNMDNLRKHTDIAYRGKYYSYYLSELFSEPVSKFDSYTFKSEDYKEDFDPEAVVLESYDSIVRNFEAREEQ